MVETSQGGNGFINTEIETFWDRLRQADAVSGEMPDSQEIASPWYVRVMLGVSGWIAALFLLGFVALGMEFILDSEVAAIVVGILVLAAAYAILSNAGNDFLLQFGLAVSFTGQALILFGFSELLDWDREIWWLVSLLQVVVAVVMPNFIQRLVAAFVAVYALSVALGGYGFIASVLAAVAVAVIWLNEFSWGRWSTLMRPIGYGLTLVLVYLEEKLLFGDVMYFLYSQREAFWTVPYRELAIGVVLVAVVARLFLRNGESWSSRRMWMALFAVATMAGLSLEAPGIAAGFLVMILGFSNANRLLIGLGIVVLLFYLSAYYYSLQTTLLVKSGILAATGMVLLSARWAVLKWVFPLKESSRE